MSAAAVVCGSGTGVHNRAPVGALRVGDVEIAAWEVSSGGFASRPIRCRFSLTDEQW